MTYYIKGGSKFNEANPTVWVALTLLGFVDSKYLDVNWKQIDYEGIIDSQDPFWLFGSASGGAKEVEIGLYNDRRIKIDTTGIYGWDGDSWEDLISGGGADPDAIHDNVDDEIHQITLKGTPVAADELVIEDSVASWAKKRIAISSLPSSGEPNTMSNEGTGTGLFWQKDGVNLELNNLKSENDRLTVSLDGTSHDIEFTINEANIVHANISGGTATSAHHIKTVSSEILLASMGEKNHVSLTNKNAETDVKHLTDAQLGALHTIYSLEVHNNDYHDPDYKVDFSENTAFNKNFGTLGTEVCVGNDARLSDARTPFAHVLATTGPHSDALPLTDLDSWVAGSIIIGGVVDWEHLVKGADTYVLKMGATYPAWGQVAWGEVTGKPTEFTPISHNNTYHSETYVTAAGAVSAIETDDTIYTKTEVNTNTYTRAQVDTAVATKDTKEEAHAYVEATALTMTQDITFKATQLFDGVDVSGIPATVTAVEERFDEQGEAFPGPGSEGDLFYSRADDSWYRWNAEAEAWIEVGVMGAIASSTDNLGNHTATTTLNMAGQKIDNVGHIQGDGYIYFAPNNDTDDELVFRTVLHEIRIWQEGSTTTTEVGYLGHSYSATTPFRYIYAKYLVDDDGTLGSYSEVDDLQLIRDLKEYKREKALSPEYPYVKRKVWDMNTLPWIKAHNKIDKMANDDNKKRYALSIGARDGFLLSALKKLLEKIDIMELKIKELEGK